MTAHARLNTILDRIIAACEGNDPQGALLADVEVVKLIKKVGDTVTPEAWLNLALKRHKEKHPYKHLALLAWLSTFNHKRQVVNQIAACQRAMMASAASQGGDNAA